MVFGEMTATDNEFIKKLQHKRTNYNEADQVRMQANSLIQLSQGIYTEAERFIYELLQNAVDAFSDTEQDSLQILIRAEQGYVSFMHNGKSFSEDDVEGISGVGMGNKGGDSKKVGYKGIGFKSVFMPGVNQVIVISDPFCFEFNKSKAHSLMPSFAGETLTEEEVPWQVIPIDAPQYRDRIADGYTVATVVHTPEAKQIAGRIERLFSNIQFLLFLRSNNVSIVFECDGEQVFRVGKKLKSEINSTTQEVELIRNDSVDSTWLINTREVSVPQPVTEALRNDFNTPNKLKGAKTVEISFAVQVDEDKVVPVDDSVVFTFLPTSYRNLEQPFLVNSNFITDAGRQQLHQESAWNKLIFGNIPRLYLEFVGGFAKKYSNYAEVLPNRYPANDTLVNIYRMELEKALETTCFIPNKDGDKYLRINEVLFENTGIIDVIGSQRFFSFINQNNPVSFSRQNIVATNEGILRYARDKVLLFDSDQLLRFLSSEETLRGIDLVTDISLIRYLRGYTEEQFGSNPRGDFWDNLRTLPFILDTNNTICRPTELFFPTDFREQNSEANKVTIINQGIYDAFKDEEGFKDWLVLLGIQELANTSFVDYMLEHQDYVTKENAISIGRFLLKACKQDGLWGKEDYVKKIKDLRFLSKGGVLRPLTNLYLSDKYGPEDAVENLCKEDNEFISNYYPDRWDSIDDWAFFFKKCGIRYKIGISETILRSRQSNPYFLIQAAQSYKEYNHGYYYNYFGRINPLENIRFRVSYFTFVNYESPDYELDKFILSRVLSQTKDNWSTVDRIIGDIHYWTEYRNVKPVEKKLFSFVPDQYRYRFDSYLQYIVSNEQKYPTTMGTSEKAEKVFLNTTGIKELCGKYLPVLDLDAQVHGTWLSIIPFKRYLSIGDLLDILDGVSKDDEAEKDEKKERVSRVYKEILDRDWHQSQEISEWVQTHKIMAQSGEFLPASELTYITVDGFKQNNNKVYCERMGQDNREKLLQLLKSFGVKVITREDIRLKIENKEEDSQWKDELLKISPYFAVMRTKGTDFADKVKEIEERISKAHFYRCEAINLTYGEQDDVISKSFYTENENFYCQKGLSRSVRTGLAISPLCGYLGLKGDSESDLLFVMMIGDHSSRVEYLSAAGYDTDGLVEEQAHDVEEHVGIPAETVSNNIDSQGANTPEVLPSTTSARVLMERGNVDREGQENINREVRIIAKQYLDEKGYDVSNWSPETSVSDVVQIVKDPNGKPVNVVIRSAEQGIIHLAPSSFKTLMSSPDNLLIVKGQNGLHCIDFEELFSGNPNVNLIFDANYTPLHYFQALGILFEYVKNTTFVIRDPVYSVRDEIRGFGLEVTNEGKVLIRGKEAI